MTVSAGAYDIFYKIADPQNGVNSMITIMA